MKVTVEGSVPTRSAMVRTFRTPHVTIAFTGDVVARLRQLADEQLELRPNPYHEADPPLAAPDEEDR